jgi:hypothetical protein
VSTTIIIIIIIINSILKPAAKSLEELNQLSGMNDAKQYGMQHRKGGLREVLTFRRRNFLLNFSTPCI